MLRKYLSFDTSPGNRSHYERIPEYEDEKVGKNWFPARCSVVLGLTVLCAVAFWSCPLQRASQHHHEQRIPTLLSLVNPGNSGFVNALQNELYERLKRATFDHVHNEKDIVEAPQLFLSKHEIDVHGSLTVSWTPGRDTSGKDVVKAADVLVLHCGTDSIHPFNNELHDGGISATYPLHILEAGTLEQVRATAQKHDGAFNPPDNTWHFTKFPVVRNEVCQFLLYRPEGADRFQFLAASDRLHIPHAHSRPTGIHWALAANDPSTMTVNFVTGDKQSGTPVIQYQIADSKHPFHGSSRLKKATGTTDTYRAGDLCHAPANLTEPGKFQSPGALHTIRVTGLLPDTLYLYQVGIAGGQGVIWSDKFTIRSPIVPGTHNFSYLVYGDQGCPENGWGEGGAMTAAMAAREIPAIRAVHHFGDLSYAQGAAHIWDAWFDMIQPFTTSVPFMVSVGNHEYCYTSSHVPGLDPSLPKDATHGFMPSWGNMGDDSGGECGVPTAKRFAMPQTNRSNGVFWYSYATGSVHTAVLSGEHDLSPGSPQHDWLLYDLGAVNRTLTPWLVVEIHRPMYHSERDRWDQNSVGIGMRYEFEDVLRDFKVDLYLSGHYHSFFRSCDGLYRSKCNNGGPTHITVGTAGARLDTAGLFWNRWTAKYIKGHYGYGRITVANASALHFEFVKAGSENDTSAGETMDDVWIVRDR